MGPDTRPWVRRNWWYTANYLTTHPCVDCGETNGMVLEFDHIRGEKKMNIKEAIWKLQFDELKTEIAKCDVRCANDHRRRHLND